MSIVGVSALWGIADDVNGTSAAIERMYIRSSIHGMAIALAN